MVCSTTQEKMIYSVERTVLAISTERYMMVSDNVNLIEIRRWMHLSLQVRSTVHDGEGCRIFSLRDLIKIFGAIRPAT